MKIKVIELDDLETGFLVGGFIIGMFAFFIGLSIGHFLK